MNLTNRRLRLVLVLVLSVWLALYYFKVHPHFERNRIVAGIGDLALSRQNSEPPPAPVEANDLPLSNRTVSATIPSELTKAVKPPLKTVAPAPASFESSSLPRGGGSRTFSKYPTRDEASGAPKGLLKCDGRLVKSELIYWRDVPVDQQLERSFGASEEQFLTFEYDAGGWNNIRMAVECMLVFAHVTGRTIVLPPTQQLYLVSKEHDSRRAFGLADFLNVTLLSSHRGWKTVMMPEFLRMIAARNDVKLPSKTTGPALWRFVKSQSDGLVPPVNRRFFSFFNDPKTNFTEKNRRFKTFAQNRQPLYYDSTLGSKRHLHAAGDGDHRILMNFYSFAFFADRKAASFYRRFIRDYGRYRDEIHCAAHLVVRELRKRGNQSTFYAIHARRNDFQYRIAKISAGDIIENLQGYKLIPKGALVFLATDDPKGVCAGCMWDRKKCSEYPIPRPKSYGCPDDPSWDAFTRHGWDVVMLGDFLPMMPHLNPNYYGMVDQLVCSRAKVFAGAFWSTFTGYIHRLRGYHGLGESSYYHTPGKLMAMREKKRMGPGWMREWRAGWTDDDAGKLII